LGIFSSEPFLVARTACCREFFHQVGELGEQ